MYTIAWATACSILLILLLRGLSHYLTKNDLAMKKNEVKWSSSFCCITRTRILLWTDRQDRQTIGNAIIADRLLTAEVTNNIMEFQVALQNGLDLALLARHAHTHYLGHNLSHICNITQGSQHGFLSLYNNKLLLITKKTNPTILFILHTLW